jgi:hypothetical protein
MRKLFVAEGGENINKQSATISELQLLKLNSLFFLYVHMAHPL